MFFFGEGFGDFLGEEEKGGFGVFSGKGEGGFGCPSEMYIFGF